MFKLLDFLFEGFQNTTNKVQWLKSTMNSSHIQNIINELAIYTSTQVDVIKHDIEEKFKQVPPPKSQIMEETTYQNALERILFQELQELYKNHESNEQKLIHKAPKFSIRIFQDLWNMIRAEHDDLFPLTSIVNKKAIMPKYILTPSPANPQFNSVTTAAITPNALCLFNVNFMQQLIDFANLKGLKAKGKKYISNNGEIPDEYAYIEFLILHELMHYVYADNYYEKQLKANPTLINYVGDFRSNYELVKAGYEQLPIGLFSDHINYDKQKTYKEMYELVKKELEDMQQEPQDGNGDGEGDGDGGSGGQPQNKDTFEVGDIVTMDGKKKYKVKGVGAKDENGDYDLDLEEIINESSVDDHRKSHRHLFESIITVKAKANNVKLVLPPSENKPQHGQSGGGKIELPTHMQPHDSHEDIEGEEGDYSGEDIEHGDMEELNARSDKKAEQMSKGLEKAQENQVSSAKEALEKIRNKENEQAQKSQDNVKTELKIIKSKISWIKLLDKLISSVFGHVQDTSYQKISKRSISSITQAAQGMPGVIKPGDVLAPEGEQRKLVIVIDSSGSMQDKIGLIQSQIYTLIKKYSKGINEKFYVVKFSDSYNVYRCNIKDDNYIPVDISEIYSNKAHPLKKDFTKGIAQLLSKSIGSSTNLSSSLSSALIQSTSKNNSVLLFSDSDIFDGSNSNNLKSILSHSKRNSIGVILKTPNDYENFVRGYGNLYSGFVTHI